MIFGMNWEAWACILTVVIILVALARGWAQPDIVLVGGMTLLMTMSLFSDKFPNPGTMAKLFGNEGLATVAVLFVVAIGLSETGGMSLITEKLLGKPKSVVNAQLRMMLPVTAASAFMNNTPVVAMFIPVINDWCKKAKISPSKLFMPLSYAAVLGGCCTLIGTSTNLVVQAFLVADQGKNTTWAAHGGGEYAVRTMGFWTVGAVGLPCAIAGVAYIVIFSRWLLKDRIPAGEEMQGDAREYMVEMLVAPGSAIDGLTVEKAGLRNLLNAYLVEVQREGQTIVAVGPEEILRGNDRLIFAGVVDSIIDLRKIRGLIPATDQVFKVSGPRHSRRLIEAVVSTTNSMVGKTIRDVRFRTKYDAAVIAVHRNGERINQKIGDITMRPGDTLLMEATPRFLRVNRNSRDFYLVSAIPDSAPPRHDRAWIALAIMVLMVVAMTFEQYISVFNTALIAAGLMILTRCTNGASARSSVDWQTLIAIGASFGIGKAMETTGAAQGLADAMGVVLKPFGPWAVLAGVYLLVLIFTEVVTNNAAAALSYPIAKAAAISLGADFMPFVVCIAMAASAGFATPLGYQTHLMVFGPGGYKFNDFLRVGVPLDILVGVIAVTLAPVFFPFYP